MIDAINEFTDVVKAKNLFEVLNKKGFFSGATYPVLTEEGRKLHAQSLAMQKEFREVVTRGISREEYEQTIITLDKMIRNLSANRRGRMS